MNFTISRVISESVAGIETLLNQAYEKNAVLESEVDEMETLRTRLQRVSDEARGAYFSFRLQFFQTSQPFHIHTFFQIWNKSCTWKTKYPLETASIPRP